MNVRVDDLMARRLEELEILREVERAERAGHQPMRIGPPDHKWHVSGCDVCIKNEQLDQLRRAA